MAGIVDVSALSEELTRDRKEYEKIFGLKMASGFDAKQDMTTLGINQEVQLIRDDIANLVQPGRTGTTNFVSNVITQKSRIGKLKPAKVDLKITEDQLYALRTTYIGRKEAADPRDIHSLAGRTYLMGKVFAGIGKEVNRAIFRGVENRATGVVGGLNLFDGLDFKFKEGFALVSASGKEDIPASNKVTGAVATVSEVNILGEVKKIVELILGSETLVEYKDDAASIFVNPIWYQWMLNALESQLSNGSQVLTKVGNKLMVNALGGTEIKPRTWMIGVNNMFWTVDGNLFYLHQDVETDIPRMKFQESDRDLKILIDFEVNVDYADGRLVILYK